jgi:hypothetical protein
MPEIVYYFVPRDRMNLPRVQEKNSEKNTDDWTEIIITDSHSIYNGKNGVKSLQSLFL